MKKSTKIRLGLFCCAIMLSSCAVGIVGISKTVTAQELAFQTIIADDDNTIANTQSISLGVGESAVIEMETKFVADMPEALGFSIYSGNGEDKIAISTNGTALSVVDENGANVNGEIIKALPNLDDILNPKYDIKGMFSVGENEEYSFQLWRKGRDYMKDYALVWEVALDAMPATEVYYALETKGATNFSVYDLQFYKSGAVQQLSYEIVGYDYTEYTQIDASGNDFSIATQQENAILSQNLYDINGKTAGISFKIVETNAQNAGFVFTQTNECKAYLGTNDLFVNYTPSGTQVLIGNALVEAQMSENLTFNEVFAQDNALYGVFDKKENAFRLYINEVLVQEITGLSYTANRAYAGLQLGENSAFSLKDFAITYVHTETEEKMQKASAKYKYIELDTSDDGKIVDILTETSVTGYITTSNFADLTKENSAIVMQFDLIAPYTFGMMMGTTVHWGQSTSGAHYLYNQNDLSDDTKVNLLGSTSWAGGYSYRITLTKNKLTTERSQLGLSAFALMEEKDLSGKTAWDWAHIRLGVQVGNNAIFNFKNFSIAINESLAGLEFSPRYQTSDIVKPVEKTVTHDNSLHGVTEMDISLNRIKGTISNKDSFSLENDKEVELFASVKASGISNQSRNRNGEQGNDFVTGDDGKEDIFESMYQTDARLNLCDSTAVIKSVSFLDLGVNINEQTTVSAVLSATELKIYIQDELVATLTDDYQSVCCMQVELSANSPIEVQGLTIKANGEALALTASEELLKLADITVYSSVPNGLQYSQKVTSFTHDNKTVIQSIGDGYLASESIVVGENSVYFEVEITEYSMQSDISATGNNFYTGFAFGSVLGLNGIEDYIHGSYGGFAVVYTNFYTASSPSAFTTVLCAEGQFNDIYFTNDLSRNEVFAAGNVVRVVYSPSEGRYSLLIKKAGESEFTLAQEIYGLTYTQDNLYVGLQTQESLTLKTDSIKYWVGKGYNASVRVGGIMKGASYSGDGVNPESVRLDYDPQTTVEGLGVSELLSLDSKNYQYSYILSEEVESFDKSDVLAIDFDVVYYRQNSTSFSDTVSVSLVDNVADFDIYSTKTAVLNCYISSEEYMYLEGDNAISFEIDVISSFSPSTANWCGFALGKQVKLPEQYLYSDVVKDLMYAKPIAYMEKGYTVKAVATKDYIKIYRKKITQTEYPDTALYTFLPEEKDGQADFSAYCRLGFQFTGTVSINASFANVRVTFFDATTQESEEQTTYFSPTLKKQLSVGKLSRDFSVSYKSEHIISNYGNASYVGCDILATGNYILEQSYAMQGHFIYSGSSVSMLINREDDEHAFDYYRMYSTNPNIDGQMRLQEIQILTFAKKNVYSAFSAGGVMTLANMRFYKKSSDYTYLSYYAQNGAILGSEEDNKSVDLEVVVEDTEKGNATGSGTYSVGSQVQLVATAKEGYIFEGWYILPDGISLNSENSYRYRISEEAIYSLDLSAELCSYLDIRVYAKFVPAKKLVLIVGDKQKEFSVIEGREYTLFPEHTSDYEFKSWKVNGVVVETDKLNSDKSYTFTMTGEEMQIEMVLEKVGGQTNSNTVTIETTVNNETDVIKIVLLAISGIMAVAFVVGIGYLIISKRKK